MVKLKTLETKPKIHPNRKSLKRVRQRPTGTVLCDTVRYDTIRYDTIPSDPANAKSTHTSGGCGYLGKERTGFSSMTLCCAELCCVVLCCALGCFVLALASASGFLGLLVVAEKTRLCCLLMRHFIH